ncbi:hypothetical protein FE257_011216 [Aspergillus nanangensis]|uniref:Uncharacterized protein n=1 Tax=Aspergillus nanangensis TaxID=2582783 RepID=A0AAD4CI19_ASPNN|nr:hypothetical protein FE257_011216 [Aspergillus nanangensis]
MVHLADMLPWKLLAAQFQFSSPPEAPASSLYFSFKPNQKIDIKTFAASFEQIISQHAYRTRQKYPKAYTAPELDHTLLDERIVRKISLTVYRWRCNSYQCESGWDRLVPDNWMLFTRTKTSCPRQDYVKYTITPCPHQSDAHVRFSYGDFDFDCRCPLPARETKTHAFIREPPLVSSDEDKDFSKVNNAALFNLQIIKTLLLYGEMDTLLRISAYPAVQYKSWIQIWGNDCETELFGAESDYRDTAIYQRTVYECTESSVSDVLVEIQKEERARAGRSGLDPRIYEDEFPYGNDPLQAMLNCQRKKPNDLPTASEVAEISAILHQLSLPEELIRPILDYAYGGFERRLPIAHDPFHPENKDELAKYLDQCWELMISCTIFTEAVGKPINWKFEVMTCLKETFTGVTGKRI